MEFNEIVSRNLSNLKIDLPSSCWMLYSGNVHITNNRSLLMDAKDLDNYYVTDNFGGSAKVVSIGDVHLKLLNNLIIELKDVHYVPDSRYNLVSQYLFGKDFAYFLDGIEGDIIFKQSNNKIAEIRFLKVIGQNNVLLTKDPSFESIVEYVLNQDEIFSKSKSIYESFSNDDDQQVNLEDYKFDKADDIEIKQKSADSVKSIHQISPSKIQNLINLPKLDPAERKLNDYLALELIKKSDELLTKLIPRNVHKLIGHFLSLEIDTVNELDQIVGLIFNKAINESIYCEQYALLCSSLLNISAENYKSNSEEPIKFYQLLSKKCIKLFTEIGNYGYEINIQERIKEIEQCDDEDKKQTLINSFFKDKISIKMRWLGNIKLIGSLYRVNDCLKDEAINFCISQLLENNNEDSFECLCVLIKFIGSKYEQTAPNALKLKFYSQIIILEELLNSNNTTPRVSSLIMELLECRRNGWKSCQVGILNKLNVIFEKPEGSQFKNEINHINGKPVRQRINNWLYSDLFKREQNANHSFVYSPEENGNTNEPETDEELVELVKKCILDSTNYRDHEFYCLEKKKFRLQVEKLPREKFKSNTNLQLKVIYSAIKINFDLHSRKDYLTELFLCLYSFNFVNKESFLKWFEYKDSTQPGNLIAINLMTNFIKKVKKHRIKKEK